MWLSNFTFTFHSHALEKEMATHSSVLAWRTPGTGEPGGLPSMGLHRVGHDWSDLAAAAVAVPAELIKPGWDHWPFNQACSRVPAVPLWRRRACSLVMPSQSHDYRSVSLSSPPDPSHSSDAPFLSPINTLNPCLQGRGLEICSSASSLGCLVNKLSLL